MGTRRTHSLEFKQRAVEASDQPGASIAGVAMAHGINANQLHKWRRQLLARKSAVTQTQMLPVTIVREATSIPTQPASRVSELDDLLPWNVADQIAKTTELATAA